MAGIVPTPGQVTPAQKAALGGFLDKELGSRKRTFVRGLTAVAPTVALFTASHPNAAWAGVAAGWFNFLLSVVVESPVGDAQYVPQHAA